MSPSFDFIFGKPAHDGDGRWIEGTVVESDLGYRFIAELSLRCSSIHCEENSVWTDACRNFQASEFAAFLRFLSTGRLKTTSRVLVLYNMSGLDPDSTSAIFNATAVWAQPWEHQSLPMQQNLVVLQGQLARWRKRARQIERFRRSAASGAEGDNS